MPPIHPKQSQNGLTRREFLRRAAATGIAVPSLAAILAACGSGAQTNVNTNPSTSGGGANKFGTGGIAGADYPLARQDAPVTWTIQPGNAAIASAMQPEKNATLRVMRWPYYFDQGVLDAFAKHYGCKVQVTEFTDMDKGLAKINSG